jgi:hypothetical protein
MIDLKFSFILFAIIAVIFLFVPIVSNDNPVDCDNLPDGAGGYYLKCKDTHMSLFTKFTQ